jgi:hypothetical protein
MLKYLLLRERKWVALTIHPKINGNKRNKTTIEPASQDCGEKIPASLIQQMMPSTTIGLNVSIDVGN